MPKTLNQTQMNGMLKALSRNKFRDKHFGVLKCLVDANSHKMAQKLYYDYISESNFAKFSVFLSKLDNLLYNMGGKPVDKNEVEEDDEIPRMGKNKDKKRKKDRD